MRSESLLRAIGSRLKTRCLLAIGPYHEIMKRKSFSEEIRDAVRRSGRNNSNLSNAMNTNRSMRYRFMNYETGISTKVLDRLAEVLDFHVVVGSARKSADE
jgi:hypothetical protein